MKFLPLLFPADQIIGHSRLRIRDRHMNAVCIGLDILFCQVGGEGRQGGSFEEYYIRADKALYYVKQNGKNSYRFYEELEEQQTDAQARKMTWR